MSPQPCFLSSPILLHNPQSKGKVHSLHPSMSNSPPSSSKLISSDTNNITEQWPQSLLAPSPAPPLSRTLYLDRRRRPPFFEGWYLRVILPNTDRSYAFMFSIESPGVGTVQLLDANEKLHVSYLSSSSKFYCRNPHTMAGHWGYANTAAGDPRPLKGIEFEHAILNGYQLCRDSCHGRFGAGENLVQWGFDYTPYLGWGDRNTKQKATATWLGWFKLFEPGYQVTMAHGMVKRGYIQIGKNRVDVKDAVVYGEKNWGGAFPSKWWWLQANGFWTSDCRDLSVTAVGAFRKVLGAQECVGMICVHYQGYMYEFANWTSSELKWEVSPWGFWKTSSKAKTGHSVEIVAHTAAKPISVLGPSMSGMTYNVRDSAFGCLSLKLINPSGQEIVHATCTNAQVEIGGGPWEGTWNASVLPLPSILRKFVNFFNGPPVATTP